MSRYRKCQDPRHDHKWGGWRLDRVAGNATRRCRRCGFTQRTKSLELLGLQVKGGKLAVHEDAA